MAIIVTGRFESDELAADAQEYLYGNGFSNESADKESENALGNIAIRNGASLTLRLTTHLEAQEGIDVLNYYGALEVELTQ